MGDLPAHSPLGASGAARWLKCAGSVRRAEGIVDEESEFAALGTAAHSLLEYSLTHRIDAWTRIGYGIESGDRWYVPKAFDNPDVGVPEGIIMVDADMARAVQMAVDAINEQHPERHQGNSWIERRFHCPSLHPLFYGTSDFVYLDADNRVLHVWDYKHGAGIVVEVDWNAQTMYYSCGVLEDLGLWGDVDTVVLHIAQPRGWHYDGPIRHWSVSTVDLEDWLDEVLIPGMKYAEENDDTHAGEHCRFCPVRLRFCPALDSKVDRWKEIWIMADKKGGVEKLDDARLGELIDLEGLVKIRFKAARDVAYGRMMAGKKVEGAKLVRARANRVWKKGAKAAAKKMFGKDAETKPDLKSPSEIEKLPKGKKFAEEWAFKPDTGLQVVPASDKRREVSRDTKAGFKAGPKRFRDV